MNHTLPKTPGFASNGIELERRSFLKRGGGLAIAAAVGMHVPFGRNYPNGLIPVALAKDDLEAYGKDADLIVLGDQPFVAETPAHLLDDNYTPASLMFVRNNGLMPKPDQLDPLDWMLTIDGESAATRKSYSLAELKVKFKPVTHHIALECAGNGRAAFNPPAKGNQWTYGGVGFPTWNGLKLADVLHASGVKDDAVYVGYHSVDAHLSGDPKKEAISRGVPVAKALEEESLIVWGMNGVDLPFAHGFPLRLIFGGYPASASGKWVTRISVRNKVHDGEKMNGRDYRMPCKGSTAGRASDNYCIIEDMPVKSIITFPKSGIQHEQSAPLQVRGRAWTSAHRVQKVDLSMDFGKTWMGTRITTPRNRYAPQRFTADVTFPAKGYYEIWARATDDGGRVQPLVVPEWNEGGYGNNACHRIAVKVA